MGELFLLNEDGARTKARTALGSVSPGSRERPLESYGALLRRPLFPLQLYVLTNPYSGRRGPGTALSDAHTWFRGQREAGAILLIFQMQKPRP